MATRDANTVTLVLATRRPIELTHYFADARGRDVGGRLRHKGRRIPARARLTTRAWR